MRGAFVRTLVELAERDPRILLLTGDLGYMALEPFAERFPQRFVNVGVAEQNMVGLATGLAEAGFVPFVYSIAPFASLRPYEFIRNGPVLHRLPVRIVGVGGGFEYGTAGPTHYGLEDVGVMRVQPGLTVIAPADHAQTRTALRKTYDLPGPVYYRLGKDDQATVRGLDGRFELGSVEKIGNGGDLALAVMGGVAGEVQTAAEDLEKLGIGCTLLVVATVSPPPTRDLVRVLAGFRTVLTVEAHYVTGGLGSLVCEIVAEHALPCRVVRCGVRAAPGGLTGSQEYMARAHGLSRKAVVAAVIQALGADRLSTPVPPSRRPVRLTANRLAARGRPRNGRRP